MINVIQNVAHKRDGTPQRVNFEEICCSSGRGRIAAGNQQTRDVDSKLAHRLRRWPSIETTLGQRLA